MAAPIRTSSSVSRDSASSLRYKALSAESYRLDSPPFTGAAAAGIGPVTRELAEGGDGTQIDKVASRLRDQLQTGQIQSSSRHRDGDVTPWELDSGMDDELDECQDCEHAEIPVDPTRLRSSSSQPVPRQGETLVRIWMLMAG